MQNDLISKSALLEALEEMQADQGGIGMDYIVFEDLVKEQPAAYSVEKVDKQILEYFKEQIDKKPDGWDIVDFSCDIRNIVRNGGKE